MNRREFLETVAVTAFVPLLGRQNAANEWGSPVFDLHFHDQGEIAVLLVSHKEAIGRVRNRISYDSAFLHVKTGIPTKLVPAR